MIVHYDEYIIICLFPLVRSSPFHLNIRVANKLANCYTRAIHINDFFPALLNIQFSPPFGFRCDPVNNENPPNNFWSIFFSSNHVGKLSYLFYFLVTIFCYTPMNLNYHRILKRERERWFHILHSINLKPINVCGCHWCRVFSLQWQCRPHTHTLT